MARRRRRAFCLGLAKAAAAVFLSGLQASAQLQWDTDIVTAGAQGGTGDWVSTNFWNDGANNIAWVNGSTASFGGTAGTVTVNEVVTANGLNFLTVTPSLARVR
jgi:hypothetical protein